MIILMPIDDRGIPDCFETAKEIIQKLQIGFYYAPNDLKNFIRCIEKLYFDKECYKVATRWHAMSVLSLQV